MSQDVREKISANIKKLREGQGLKREELSLILGFDNSYISKLEKCKVNITIDKIAQIADYFKIPASKLLS